MPLPSGVETRTVRLTVPLDTLGHDPKIFSGIVQPDQTLIWAATGERLWPTGARLPDPAGGYLDFDVPIVDQDGWLDFEGNPVTGWVYKLVVTGTWEVDRTSKVKYFQVLEATPALIDLELLPDGPVTPPVDPGDPYVSTFLGHSGAITGATLEAAMHPIFQRRVFYTPEDYGAEGDGVEDDTEAIQDAIDAAHDEGGGVVFLAKRYGWSGDLLIKGGVTLLGAGNPQIEVPSQPELGLVALASDSRVVYGQLNDGSGSSNDNPGPMMNVYIDGDDVAGTGSELLRLEAANATLFNVSVRKSLGNGVDTASSQNVVMYNPQFGECFAGTALVHRANEPGNQGPGGCKVYGGHIGDSDVCLRVTSHGNTDFSAPHDNIFDGVLFETGRTEGESITANVLLESGETVFRSCVFTIGANVEAIDEECNLLISNDIYVAQSTVATLDSCYLGGGAGTEKADHNIRVTSGGAFNEVRIYGRTQVANATYILATDGSGVDLVGSVDGPVTFITGTYTNWFVGINGATTTGILRRSQSPIRWETPASGLPNPIQIRQWGDAANRLQISNTGELRFLDPSTGATRAAIVPNTTGLSINGESILQVAGYTTAGRPLASLIPHRMIFDTDLKIPLWSDGTSWIAAGTSGGTAAQPLDSDLTAIAALSTTSYGRALLALADQAALVALLPAYQPLDGDLTNIAALSTVIYGRSLLTLSSATALTAEILAASETQSGRLEIATQAETNTGTDDVRAVTPLKLQTRLAAYAQPLDSDLTAIAALSTTSYGRALLALADQAALTAALANGTESLPGIVELATQAETNTGTDDARAVTPLKLATRLAAYAQPLDSDLTSIAALTTTSYGRALLELANQAALLGLFPAASETTASIAEIATQAETNTGTDDARFVTPLKLATRLAAAYQPLDTDLSAIAALTSAADKLPYATGAGTWTMADITNAGRTLLAAADAAAVRAAIFAAHSRPTINTQTGTAYTLVLTDEQKVIQVNNSGAHTLTVPANASVAFSVNTQLEIVRLHATGTVTIAPDTGVTINSRGGLLSLNGQYASVRLRKRAADTWVLTGDLA